MRKVKPHKYNYFYKITNNINNHFYYGVHCTDNLDDGYMGSGIRLHYAYKKYGIENFTKEILKYFDTPDDAFRYESEYVNEELVKDPNCYNIQLGGSGWNTIGLVSVKDKHNNTFLTSISDPRYLSGELVGVSKNFILVRDKHNKCFRVNKDDTRYLSGELCGVTKGKVYVKDANNNKFWIDVNDERYISKEVVSVHANNLVVKDKYGKFYYVSCDDSRYLSGELKCVWCGLKHSEETKRKISEHHKNKKIGVGKSNPQYGKCWIYRIIDNKLENKSIFKDDLNNYLSEGWIKGRKMHL